MTLQKENEMLRGLLRELREITSEYAWDADLEARVDAALSQQAEPAPAQDELLPCPFCGGEPNLTYGDYVRDDLSLMPVVECKSCSAWVRVEDWNRRATRPAQAEHQPVAEVLWPDEPGRRGGFSQIGHYDDPRLPVGAKLYAAPIAQPAPQTAAKMPCGTAVTNVYEAYEAGKRAAAPQPEQSGLVEAELAIRKFESANWHGSKGYHAGLLKAADIVAALSAQRGDA